MNEFSETNDTSSETRDVQPEGASFSDTFEGIETSMEFSNRDGELLPSGSTALEEGFGIGESDDFEITDINAPSLELSEVKEAEDLRDDAIARILEQDSTYLLPDSLARLEGHQETISIVPYNNDGVYGSHNYEHGKTEIELIKALPSTMRLTAIHEYEHVASYHNEIVEKHHNSTLHTIQVGLRTKEYIVDRDGERLLYRNEGENLNEGLTQYLTEDKLSSEELSMAQAMRIYPFATEAAASLSDILGSASIREDFYEGTSHIRDALDETLGQGTFQRFCSCLDQASESPESDQRREAMREANKILNTLAAQKAAEKQNKEA